MLRILHAGFGVSGVFLGTGYEFRTAEAGVFQACRDLLGAGGDQEAFGCSPQKHGRDYHHDLARVFADYDGTACSAISLISQIPAEKCEPNCDWLV